MTFKVLNPQTVSFLTGLTLPLLSHQDSPFQLHRMSPSNTSRPFVQSLVLLDFLLFPASKQRSVLGLRFLLSLPCQSPPVSWLCIPIFRMMTPKHISHLSSEVQSPILPWMFKRCHKPHTSKAELFMPYSLWPKLLLPQSSLSHSCSILLIPQCKILNIDIFPPLSLIQCLQPISKFCQLHHHVILHFQTLAAICLITSHNYQLSPRLLK